MHLKFKKLDKSAHLPSRSHEGDAGLDLTAVTVDKSHERYWEYGTGLAVEIPPGMVGLLFPRSSISKTAHSLRNSVGIIDSGYRGEIKVRLSPDSSSSAYGVGDRIAQLLIMEVPLLKVVEEEELSPSQRGSSGFGSTGG